MVRHTITMITTKLSNKGQVIIPKHLRYSYHWEVGQDLVVIDTGDGILLKTKPSFPETTLDQVASCLKYTGQAKSLSDMQNAMSKGSGNYTEERDELLGDPSVDDLFDVIETS